MGLRSIGFTNAYSFPDIHADKLGMGSQLRRYYMLYPFGKIKVKTYLWSNFCYVGSLLVLGKGRTLTSEMIVCAENKPYKKFSNSIAYALHGHYLSFENNEENRKIFSPYFTGQL